jgi:hypothetical protein
MKNVLIVIVLVLIGIVLYHAYNSGAFEPKSRRGKRVRPAGTVGNVVRSGRDVGEGASKAFRAVDFGPQR